MAEMASNVIIIPAKPELVGKALPKRQLRVAAYCRVSTDDEEQITSYEAQKHYYTDKIMTNPAWTMAGLFADRGLTGTSARKRPEFLRMIRKCKQKKIDLILTKSISRFARNTVDCLQYTRLLRSLGIAVIFEEQNINTLDSESEMLITMLGAFAQAESESISGNVKWGKRQAMREGRAIIQYKRLYAYEKGADGKPSIIPEQAEVVRRIYDRFLAGDSFPMIREMLENEGILNVAGGTDWTHSAIRSILCNEKYCGDVLLQKTYIDDCINRKVIKNTGQLPMYLIQNHHEGIVDRKTFDAAQAELARRNAIKSPSAKRAPTGRSCYCSKYALSERLVCGECGTMYQRCTWSRNGKKRIVWRCISRVDYGTKYCHSSPTVDEDILHQSILAAINSAVSDKETLIRMLTEEMKKVLIPAPGSMMSMADIDRRIEELNQETRRLVTKVAETQDTERYTPQLKAIVDELAMLKEKKSALEEQYSKKQGEMHRIDAAEELMQNLPMTVTEWDESMIRQLVETVKILTAEKIVVYLHGGIEIEQDMIH